MSIRVGGMAESTYPVGADTFEVELPPNGASPTFQSRPLFWPQLRVGGVSNPNSEARKGAV